MSETTTNTLGLAIGLQKHSCKVTLPTGESASISVYVDYSTASDNDIINWLNSNRIIAGQRPWRGLSLDEVKALDGQTFTAQNIGQKVKSREEKVQALVNAGLPRQLAEFSVDNPAEFNKVVGNITAETTPPKESELDHEIGEDVEVEETNE